MNKHILSTITALSLSATAFGQTGNVGIGTTTPTEKLEIRGNVKIQNSTTSLNTTMGNNNTGAWVDFKSGNVAKSNIFYSLDSNTLNLNTFSNSGNTILNSLSGNVGIGTINAPTEKLEVHGSVKIVDGTQGSGKVLVSDANGKTSWDFPTMSYSSTLGVRDGSTIYPGSCLATNDSVYKYTGTTITLPNKGRYVIHLNLLVSSIPSVSTEITPNALPHTIPSSPSNALTSGQGVAVKACFYDQLLANGIPQHPVYKTPTLMNGFSIYSSYLFPPFGIMSGYSSIVIDNPNSGSKTFYLYAKAEGHGLPTGTVKYIYEFSSNRWIEESITAYKISN